jgi:hypothetical protein
MFANKVAEDAALPLKLYASSLTGQGLSLDVSRGARWGCGG